MLQQKVIHSLAKSFTFYILNFIFLQLSYNIQQKLNISYFFIADLPCSSNAEISYQELDSNQMYFYHDNYQQVLPSNENYHHDNHRGEVQELAGITSLPPINTFQLDKPNIKEGITPEGNSPQLAELRVVGSETSGDLGYHDYEGVNLQNVSFTPFHMSKVS